MSNLLPDLTGYDPVFVFGALLLCATTMLMAVRMVCRASMVRGQSRAKRLVFAAAVAGNGIWATHFVAMLDCKTNMAAAMGTPYEMMLTALSVLVAGGLFLPSWWTECHARKLSRSPLTALLMTAAVGGMHYIGVAATQSHNLFPVPPARMLLSLTASFILFYIGSLVLRRQQGTKRALAALPWVLGVCTLHFIGMPDVIMAPERMAPHAQDLSLAGMVGAGTSTFLGLAFVFVLLEYRAAKRKSEDNMRARSFADVALEGLVVTTGGMILDANSAFWKLTGASHHDAGHLKNCLPALATDEMVRVLVQEETPREMMLQKKNGEHVPVEVYARESAWRGKPRTILAIIDLRARKEAEAALQELAITDTLTGIGNRSFFVSSLSVLLQSSHQKGQVAVFLIDVDRFKNINETAGHAAGDAVLAHIARRIQTLAPPDAIMARIAGDEFAVAYVVAHRDVMEFALYMAQGLKIPVPDAQGELPVSVSVGFVVSDDEIRDGDALLHCSGMALLAAKQAGRGNVREYDSSFDSSIKHRIRMEREMQLALERNEFFLEYQPIMCTRDRKLTGYEALVRWQHPELGRVPPDQFIGIAEECGLITQLGEWVARRACLDAMEWGNALSVSVNVSPIQFATSDLPEIMSRILYETGLEAKRLSIEITENIFLQGSQNIEILRKLRALGIGIVMDDFGTGYSSLSYLQDFQFDKVKIDRSFIWGMLEKTHSAAIVNAILSLGHDLGIDIVAEGIETAEQLAYLEKRSCSLVQGYFIGRPCKTIAEAPRTEAMQVAVAAA
ncbi:bifunctional diguanylate cyclase/phosphodiesterase [Acetobacter conturbans]|uniref:EAL domain-containing protein n=1 Tax=Acetobacter conturbans TaxID=1737472 RepID=A0ABX0K5S3_9PROT|nr:EAL domain-containing protein [Acetobacter conturbans]NHN88764.1 EAL domain-containing protein [Acetobacter conturbans]